MRILLPVLEFKYLSFSVGFTGYYPFFLLSSVEIYSPVFNVSTRFDDSLLETKNPSGLVLSFKLPFEAATRPGRCRIFVPLLNFRLNLSLKLLT